MTARTHRGFTLIELLVATSIAVILLVLAAPAYFRWISDAEVANGASTLADGLRLAQAEAIKRNTNVEFTLDTAAGWTVQLPGSGTPIKLNKFAEGAKDSAFAPTPATSTTVTFNALGQIEPANAAAPLLPFSTVNISMSSGSRPLRVLVGGGTTGIKVCDPKFVWPDPQGCP
jgi:type IV fimbrial biogenesis protein FimT